MANCEAFQRSCHYATLGLPADSAEEQVKKAFRTLALQWHPDKNSGDVSAQQKFVELRIAYEALTSPPPTLCPRDQMEVLRQTFPALRVEGSFPSVGKPSVLFLSDSSGRPSKSKGGCSYVGDDVAQGLKGSTLLYLTYDGGHLSHLLRVLKSLPDFCHIHFMWMKNETDVNYDTLGELLAVIKRKTVTAHLVLGASGESFRYDSATSAAHDTKVEAARAYVFDRLTEGVSMSTGVTEFSSFPKMNGEHIPSEYRHEFVLLMQSYFGGSIFCAPREQKYLRPDDHVVYRGDDYIQVHRRVSAHPAAPPSRFVFYWKQTSRIPVTPVAPAIVQDIFAKILNGEMTEEIQSMKTCDPRTHANGRLTKDWGEYQLAVLLGKKANHADQALPWKAYRDLFLREEHWTKAVDAANDARPDTDDTGEGEQVTLTSAAVARILEYLPVAHAACLSTGKFLEGRVARKVKSVHTRASASATLKNHSGGFIFCEFCCQWRSAQGYRHHLCSCVQLKDLPRALCFAAAQLKHPEPAWDIYRSLYKSVPDYVIAAMPWTEKAMFDAVARGKPYARRDI